MTACALCHHSTLHDKVCRTDGCECVVYVTVGYGPNPPPVVIELAPDEVRDLAADFAQAASRRERIRVMIENGFFKVSPGGHRWSVGFGEVWR